MLKSYFLAKLLKIIRLSSFKDCSIHKTSRVSSGCTLTKVTMGRYSYTGENTRITDTIIGSFCSIGMNCTIGGGLHPLYMVSTSPVFLNGKNIMRKHFSNHDFLSSETVTIGNDVWIGSYAFIMSGLTIGDGAVIGANSVVTHDIEPYSIVAGVPAKQIRKRFDDETIDGLLKTKWWDMQESELEEVAPLFNTPDRFLLRKNKEKELNEDSIC